MLRGRLEGQKQGQGHSDGGEPALLLEVAIKKPLEVPLRARATNRQQQEHLARELEVLRLFEVRMGTAEKGLLLPVPASQGFTLDPKDPYILSLPVGISLAWRARTLRTQLSRRAEARALSDCLKAVLTAAHQMGVCHTDLRPDNVIYDPQRQLYTVIDWGLAREPGQELHHYEGAIPFFSNAVVRQLLFKKEEEAEREWKRGRGVDEHEVVRLAASDAVEREEAEGWERVDHSASNSRKSRRSRKRKAAEPAGPASATVVRYYKEDDLESVKYIVYAFVRGASNLAVPWDLTQVPLEDMVVTRAAECGALALNT